MPITDIVAKINAAGGVARQNRYTVTIPTSMLLSKANAQFDAQQQNTGTTDTVNWMKDFLDSDVNELGLRLTAFCDKSELPGYQFQTEAISGTYGPTFKVPHRQEYPDINMTFMCGADMAERYFFEAWMFMVIDPITHDLNYLSEYAVNIDIAQYQETPVDNQLHASYVTTLIDAYPISFSTQALDYSATNSIQSLQVTFTYKSAVPFTGKESTTDTARRGTPELFSTYQTNNAAKRNGHNITITDRQTPPKK